MLKSFIKFIFCASPLIFIIGVSNIFADDNSVFISVRAIQASRVTTNQVNQAGHKVLREISPEIVDIKGKLRKLNYNSFNLIGSENKIVPINTKESFTLSDGQKVTLRPVSKKDGKVCLWINWKDQNGMNLLDTRLHFSGPETMITGTDATPESGMILAIDVK
ncbi:MAG: hypothetical protein SGJ02_02825 [bacterium]|nr:hypothetical protein [bacterium]